jgi:hypothetical protein
MSTRGVRRKYVSTLLPSLRIRWGFRVASEHKLVYNETFEERSILSKYKEGEN